MSGTWLSDMHITQPLHQFDVIHSATTSTTNRLPQPPPLLLLLLSPCCGCPPTHYAQTLRQEPAKPWSAFATRRL